MGTHAAWCQPRPAMLLPSVIAKTAHGVRYRACRHGPVRGQSDTCPSAVETHADPDHQARHDPAEQRQAAERVARATRGEPAAGERGA